MKSFETHMEEQEGVFFTATICLSVSGAAGGTPSTPADKAGGQTAADRRTGPVVAMRVKRRVQSHAALSPPREAFSPAGARGMDSRVRLLRPAFAASNDGAPLREAAAFGRSRLPHASEEFR